MRLKVLIFFSLISLWSRSVFASWTSLAPDLSGVQADVVTTVVSIVGIVVAVFGVGMLIRVLLR